MQEFEKPGSYTENDRPREDDRFAVGKEITVFRSSGQLDDGWKIFGAAGNRLFVKKEAPEGILEKRISIESAEAANPERREANIDRATAEKIGGEVIGIAQYDLIDDKNDRVFNPDHFNDVVENARRLSQSYGTLEPLEAVQVETQPSTPEKKSRYEALKEWLPPVTNDGSEAQMKYYAKYVTAENRQHSLEMLQNVLKYDKKMQAALDEAGIPSNEMAAVDAIRENPDVRFKFAERIAEKIDALAADPYTDFGDRLLSRDPNWLKSDAVINKKMPSRVYAVSMALKMLGGEFRKRDDTDDFERKPGGTQVISGQHRHAARAALFSTVA